MGASGSSTSWPPYLPFGRQEQFHCVGDPGFVVLPAGLYAQSSRSGLRGGSAHPREVSAYMNGHRQRPREAGAQPPSHTWGPEPQPGSLSQPPPAPGRLTHSALCHQIPELHMIRTGGGRHGPVQGRHLTHLLMTELPAQWYVAFGLNPPDDRA